MSLYTAGKDECRAWTIRKGSLAPTAGGKIHSDIERGFIRVEVIKYSDLIALWGQSGKTRANKEEHGGGLRLRRLVPAPYIAKKLLAASLGIELCQEMSRDCFFPCVVEKW